MRFIHAADLHIDSPLRGLSRYPGAPLDRLRGATRRALERLVELAIDEKVDCVLLAGDLYDRDWQDFHTGLYVRAQLVRLGKAGIQVFIVQGNHDAQGVISRQVPWPVNVNIFPSNMAKTFHLESLGVAIHGLSFPNREVPEDLVPRYPQAISGVFNIGVLHTSLTGMAGHDTYAPTSLSVLQAKGYDYWALGHVHNRQVVCETPRVVFPGNLQGRNARETGPKGCELVEVNGLVVKARFVPLDVVRWHQIEIQLGSVQNLDAFRQVVADALQLAAADAVDTLHAVRVLLKGSTALHALESRQPGTLEAAVHAAAQDIADTNVWIEKVKLDLQTPLDRVQLAQGTDALGELVRWVDDLSADKAALQTLCSEALADMLKKIPKEVRDSAAHDLALDDLPNLDNDSELQHLLQDAEATLLARLNKAEV